MGKPLRRDKVLAATEGGVYIAPLCTGAVYSSTVALYYSCTVPECKATALTPTVGEGGGGLGLSGHGGAVGGQDQGAQDGGGGVHGYYCNEVIMRE